MRDIPYKLESVGITGLLEQLSGLLRVVWIWLDAFHITIRARYGKLTGGISMAAVDILDYRIPVYGDRKCLPHPWIKEGILSVLITRCLLPCHVDIDVHNIGTCDRLDFGIGSSCDTVDVPDRNIVNEVNFAAEKGCDSRGIIFQRSHDRPLDLRFRTPVILVRVKGYVVFLDPLNELVRACPYRLFEYPLLAHLLKVLFA